MAHGSTGQGRPCGKVLSAGGQELFVPALTASSLYQHLRHPRQLHEGGWVLWRSLPALKLWDSRKYNDSCKSTLMIHPINSHCLNRNDVWLQSSNAITRRRGQQQVACGSHRHPGPEPHTDDEPLASSADSRAAGNLAGGSPEVSSCHLADIYHVMNEVPFRPLSSWISHDH